MEEEIKNHENFFAYPMLVCNLLHFDLRLVHQKRCENTGFMGTAFTIYLLIEACDETDWYVGKYIHTFTQICSERLIGKRVYFTFNGLKEKEEDGKTSE